MDEVAVTLAEPLTTDEEVPADIEPIPETEELETAPDAPEEYDPW